MSREQPSATHTFQTEGYNDYLDGYGITECPYERGSDEAALWLEGWEEARQEDGNE